MNASSKHKNKNKSSKRKSPQLLPALVAVGGACGLAAMPVNALELGDIQVNSALGQPLRASIAYALNPTEQLFNYCIYLRPGAPGSGMPTMGDARISVTDNAILLTGKTPIREPMLSMQVVVDCAYTPHLLREYTLMIDPVSPVITVRSIVESNTIAGAVPQAQPIAPVASETRPAIAQTTRTPAVQTLVEQSPIGVNTSYRVQPGDTLSTIVSRIENRSIGLWPAVDVVFAANPDAFVDQDINRLIAGSELFIPRLTENVSVAAESTAPSPTTNIDEPGAAIDLVGDYSPTDSATVTETRPGAEASTSPVIDEVPETPAATVGPAPVVEDSTAISQQVSELRPGDVIMSPIGSGSTEIVIPDTAIDNQSASVSVINTTTANNTGTSGALNWLIWLGGTGVALILGLLLFGRALRERFGSIGVGTPQAPGRQRDDDQTQESRVIQDLDFDFEDTINAEAISLDADLGAGTGLHTSSEMDVAQDFGFSATGQVPNELDLEITEDAAREPEASPTDVIPPNHREELVSILEKEVPPTEDDSEDYDMSMIVDATKQPIGDYDATAKDLQAVQIDATDIKDDDSDYTMSSAVDYDTLEQDYQEEFTATQALNAEIEQAAKDLANRMEDDESDDATTEMPIAQSSATDIHNAELTAEMPCPNVTSELPAVGSVDDPSIELPAVSDSDITAELTANLPNSIEAENDPMADGNDPNITVEMSAAGSDITVEMHVESGKIDTKKKKK